MGRSRRRGVSNASLRAAGRIMAKRDDEAASIAQRVYNAAAEEKQERAQDVLPLSVWAPLVVAAETIAPVVLRANGMEESEEAAIDVAAYLVAGFTSAAHLFDREHFEAWRHRSDEAAG